MKLDYLRVAQSSVSIGDPHICSDSINRNSLLNAVYEPLVKRGKPGYFIPVLSREWGIDSDGLTWTFRVRDNVQFHNGETLTANDILATMKRVIDPSIGGAYGTQGVYASYIGDATFAAPRKDVFQIKTKEPMADLLDLLSEMPIAPEDELSRLPNEYIGTGNYFIGSKHREEVVLERNRSHWGKTAYADEVTFIEEPDSRVRSEMVSDNDVQIGALIDLDDIEPHRNAGKSSLVSLESSLCIIFMMNSQEGPCSDTRVRQALNYGLDIDYIVEKVKHGAATRLNGFLTPHHYGYNPETKQYPYDPEHAKKLLSDAGYVDGLKLTIDLPTTMPDEALELGEIMKDQYSRLGIDVELAPYSDRPGYAEMVRAKHIHDLCCFDSSPLSTFRVLREKIHSGYKGPWWEGYANPEVDRLINLAQKTFDTGKREELYRQIFQIIRDDAPWLFLYRPTYYWAVSKEIGDWKPTSTGLIKLSD